MELVKTILVQAREYLQSGLSVIPIRNDGTKAPNLPAGHPILRRVRKASQQELVQWFPSQGARGIAIQCGAISGGLAVLDFDDPDCYGPFASQVGALLLNLPKVHTPKRSVSGNPGVHLYARVEGIAPRTEVLARFPNGAVRIEVRGEGAYCVAPPSHGSCHQTGRPWVLAEGLPRLTQVPNIPQNHWQTLLRLAKSFNLLGKPKSYPERLNGIGRGMVTGIRPVDDYNKKADVRDVLREAGACLVRITTNGTEYWRRPNALHANGVDATYGYRGRRSFHVFSTSWAPFEPMMSYSPFEVYAILKHGGDFRAAVQELAQKEYGSNGK